MTTATLNFARHRLAILRDELQAQLANLKQGGSAYKFAKGRLIGTMDCIQVCDECALAQEQGEPTELRPDQVAWLVGRRGGK